MLNLFSRFSPRITAADADYPYGSIKNESVPGANDGTPLNADWGNDYAGFDAALMSEAGLTPSGDPDTAPASQRLDALNLLYGTNVASISDLDGELQSGAGALLANLIIIPSDATMGAEPNIVIAEYWMDETPGTRMTVGDTWDSALYGSQTEINFPKIYDLDGVSGIGSRNVTDGNELTGFVKILPEYKSFFTIWQMGVPAGYYFSGASAVETLPPGSNLKMIWDTWDALGANDYNDVVNSLLMNSLRL